MHARQMCSAIILAIVVAIGCGSGKPQDASATPNNDPTQTSVDRPIQLAQAPATTEVSASGGGSLKGTVRFEGTAPESEVVKMNADPVCQQQHKEPVRTEGVAVNANGTLKNVFVYIKGEVTGAYPTPTQPVVLDQSGCWYQPHVMGIQINQPFEILNSDSTLHNVNAKPQVNPPFNVAQPVKGMRTTKKFPKPEVMVKFKCNVHPWMSAYLGVLPHPFFSVSDEQGAFSIVGLPAGTYTIEAWHEVYGTQTQSVTVADGQAAELEFTFRAPNQ